MNQLNLLKTIFCNYFQEIDSSLSDFFQSFFTKLWIEN